MGENPHRFTYHPGNAWRPTRKGLAARATRRATASARREQRERRLLWLQAWAAFDLGALR